MKIKIATTLDEIEALVGSVDEHGIQTGQLLDAIDATRKTLKEESVMLAKDWRTKENVDTAKELEERQKLQADAELELNK